jgi:branched-chain amino acid transport system ATP-binding protein
MLQIRDLHVHYGNVEAIKGLSVEIAAKEIVVVIGANGAGKSTILRTIIGLIKPSSGEIWFEGKNISRGRAYDLTRRGICLIPEGRQIFPDLSVRENMLLGAYQRMRKGQKESVEKDIDRFFGLFPILDKRKGQLGGTLSGGEQQMLALARGLMSSPRLLLMDEPSLGLAPKIARQIFDTIGSLNREGRTILLVEQLAWLGLGVCNRGYVLENGRIVLSGNRDDLLANAKIVDAYVGRKKKES